MTTTLRAELQQRKPFSSLEQEATLSIARTEAALREPMEELLKGADVSLTQYNVLRILRGVHPGGHPRHEIARRMIHRAPDVTRMLDRLAGQGLVRRIRNPEDRRESVATITPAGLALLARVDPEVHAAQRDFTASLTAPELRRLVRLCDALVP